MTSDAERSLEALERLAELNGVQTSYDDVNGQSKPATPQALLAALRALGTAIESLDEAPALLRQQLRERWSYKTEPVVVAWEGLDSAQELRLPADATGELTYVLEIEDGERREDTIAVESLPVAARVEHDGIEYVARTLALGALPPGYHRLLVRGTGIEQETLVLAAPREVYEHPDDRKRWGVFLPLYALHTRRGEGAGDFTDLSALADWTRARGGDLVATLPLLPAYLDEPFSPSPYSPVSRLFWNEFYVDPSRSPLLERCAEARELLDSAETRRDAEALRNEPFVDYRRLMRSKRPVLEALARCAFETDRDAIEARLRERPEVEDYAHFRAVQERLRMPWREWPQRLQERRIEAADYDESTYQYYAYAQLLASDQLEELSRTLRARGQDFYLDVPVGSNPDGFDNWRYRDVFVNDAAAGAPPDTAFTTGQDWGLPPLHPLRLRETGYAYFRSVIGHHLALANVLRIDHVMGLHRLYCIPAGVPSTEGVYVRYAADEMYAILSIESHRHEATVVGENLGMVPEYIEAALEEHGVYKSYVIEYEVSLRPGESPRQPPARSFASIATHDMPPFASWWSGSDIDERLRLGIVDEGDAESERGVRETLKTNLVELLKRDGLLADAAEINRTAVFAATLRFLRASPARYVLVNAEDLWGETEAQNVPGTVDEHPNWVRRARRALEEFPETIPGLD